uniref:Uncharacterized protein n=1 Tax=Vespula pensylvanica TaxID=30213 RepID=A0A834PDL7_VESPE|nr:hypothetical protein H0235_000085 [Vespula pensylvanica]
MVVAKEWREERRYKEDGHQVGRLAWPRLRERAFGNGATTKTKDALPITEDNSTAEFSAGFSAKCLPRCALALRSLLSSPWYVPYSTKTSTWMSLLLLEAKCNLVSYVEIKIQQFR